MSSQKSDQVASRRIKYTLRAQMHERGHPCHAQVEYSVSSLPRAVMCVVCALRYWLNGPGSDDVFCALMGEMAHFLEEGEANARSNGTFERSFEQWGLPSGPVPFRFILTLDNDD